MKLEELLPAMEMEFELFEVEKRPAEEMWYVIRNSRGVDVVSCAPQSIRNLPHIGPFFTKDEAEAQRKRWIPARKYRRHPWEK